MRNETLQRREGLSLINYTGNGCYFEATVCYHREDPVTLFMRITYKFFGNVYLERKGRTL